MSTDLRHTARNYVLLRRALGYQLRGYDRVLDDLVSDLARAGTGTLTIELAVAWATKPAEVPPFRWKARLGIARGFWALPADPRPGHAGAANQPAGVPPLAAGPLPLQPDRDPDAAGTHTLTPTLQGATYRTLLGLLAVTGMRVGEAIALDRDKVDLRARRLVISHAKGGSRQLPLHPSTARELVSYARLRDQLCPAPGTASFFVSTVATRPIYECIRETFTDLRAVTGLDTRRPIPRIHDLRHSFAVETLLGWHRTGVDVAARLPLLGAWMGHRHPASTYYYLQAAPELLALAAQRLPDLRISS